MNELTVYRIVGLDLKGETVKLGTNYFEQVSVVKDTRVCTQ